MKVRKSRKRKTGNSLSSKRHDSFIRPREGNESSFLQPQARMLRNNTALPETVQSKMEHGLGEDFSSVKIHKESAEATRMGALAFTNGENVHFAPGQFHPHTTPGQELIGHELAHVKQQRQGRVQHGIQAKGLSLNGDRSLEAEADVLGKRAASFNKKDAFASQLFSANGKAKSGVVQMKQDTKALNTKLVSKTAYLINESNHTIYYKPENTSEALPLGAHKTLYEPIDGAATTKYSNAVIKIPTGADLTVTSEGGADIDFYGLGGVSRLFGYGWITSVPDSGWQQLFDKAKEIGKQKY